MPAAILEEKVYPTDLGDRQWEIIKHDPTSEGFYVLPRRWVVERTFAWPGRRQGSAKITSNIHKAVKLWRRSQWSTHATKV